MVLKKVIIIMEYPGYGKDGLCHGPRFDGGAKSAWQELKLITLNK